MIPAGRRCSFWSSDGVLGNRPVPPPALPISPDIAPQEARSAVRLGSSGGLATSQPSACRERVCPARGCSIRKNLLEPLLRPRNHPGGVEGYCRFLLSPKHCGSIPLSHASPRSLAQSDRKNRSRPRQLKAVHPYGRSRSFSRGDDQGLSAALSA